MFRQRRGEDDAQTLFKAGLLITDVAGEQVKL